MDQQRYSVRSPGSDRGSKAVAIDAAFGVEDKGSAFGYSTWKGKTVNLKEEATGDSFNEPLSDDTTSTPSFPAYKNQGLTGSHATFPKVKAVKIKSATLSRAIAQSKRARQTTHKYGT